MEGFFKWFQRQGMSQNEPWLILGKGPSFSKRDQFDLSRFHVLSLNHAVREQSVMVAHMIDFDVVNACGKIIEKNAQYLVLPWIPHVNNKPGHQNLAALAQTNPILRRMDEQGRLLWYNLRTASERHEGAPVIQVKFFSIEAVLNLLAEAGVRTVRSLGIDGGASYSDDFEGLKETTLLSNSRKSFDKQFEEIATTLLNTGIDYAPLDVESPLRVYVATTEAQMLSVKVLEYSIRKHTSMSSKIFPLHLSDIPVPTPKDIANHPRTPFSFQRLLIPMLCDYQGRAIYLDSDMQVLKDLRELWMLPFRDADLLAAREPGASGRRPQFSVMLLNCEKLKWDINAIVENLDKGVFNYEQLMHEMVVAKHIRTDIDPIWNSLEHYESGKTALIHYTDMPTQPWVSRDNPLNYIWTRDMFEAIDRGHISENEIERDVSLGYIRPSLLYQIEHRIDDSVLLPKKARLLDKGFIPPFRSIHKHHSLPWLNPVSFLRAAVRHYYHKSSLGRLQRKVQDWLP